MASVILMTCFAVLGVCSILDGNWVLGMVDIALAAGYSYLVLRWLQE